MSLKNFFNPKSIAIVGASKEEGRVGNVIVKNVLGLGYDGKVFFVNPKYKEIFGKKCYPDLTSVEEKVDLAILAIPAKLIFDEIKKNSSRIKNFVIISAGFSEMDGEGKKRERDLLGLALEEKINILGPNCLGFISPWISLNASFAGGLPEKGNISFVSQSGALAVALMDVARKENFKFSNIISIGNKMMLDEVALLNFLEKDERTKVIGMYLEGVKNGLEFIKVARAVSKKKPIIILKAGKSLKAQKAISSHTGALAGDDEVISAVFQKAGILRANNLEEFFNLLNLAKDSFPPQKKETVIITNAGGAGVLATDAFSEKKLELFEIPQKAKSNLATFLPKEASLENPIDLLGDAKEDRYLKALEIMDKQKEVGSIVSILTPQDQTPVDKIAQKIIEFKKRSKKTIATVFLGGEKVEKAIDNLKKNGICNFNFPEEAINSLNKYYMWNQFKNLKIRSESKIINEKRQEKIVKIIRKAKSEGRRALFFQESLKVMEMYGISVVKSFSFSPNDFEKISEKEFNFPVVLKVDSDKVLHKTDRNGIILNIDNFGEFKTAFLKMKENFPSAEYFLVQPMVSSGMEIIMGIKRDEIFGPVVIYGLGGIYAENFSLVDYLIPPLSLEQIEENIQKGKMNFIFTGARGQKKYNLFEMAQNLQKITQIALEISEILEFDINPMVIYNNGKECLALDIKIII